MTPKLKTILILHIKDMTENENIIDASHVTCISL